MRFALALFALLVLTACAVPAPSGSGEPGLIAPLAQVSDAKPGLPVLVFVYTDG